MTRLAATLFAAALPLLAAAHDVPSQPADVTTAAPAADVPTLRAGRYLAVGGGGFTELEGDGDGAAARVRFGGSRRGPVETGVEGGFLGSRDGAQRGFLALGLSAYTPGGRFFVRVAGGAAASRSGLGALGLLGAGFALGPENATRLTLNFEAAVQRVSDPETLGLAWLGLEWR